MAEVGEPPQNGYADRLIHIIKREEVDFSDYDDHHDAPGQIGQLFLGRVHAQKGSLSARLPDPAKFESQWLGSQRYLMKKLPMPCPLCVQLCGAITYLYFQL